MERRQLGRRTRGTPEGWEKNRNHMATRRSEVLTVVMISTRNPKWHHYESTGYDWINDHFCFNRTQLK
jgi:hypothetical protein